MFYFTLTIKINSRSKENSFVSNRCSQSSVSLFACFFCTCFLVENVNLYLQRDAVRLASNLSTREKMDVVSISFQPASSVVEWLLTQDLPFRKAIAKILTSTNFTVIISFLC